MIVSMCFLCIDASTDMQYDILGWSRDLTEPWLKVKFWHWRLRSTYIDFDAARQGQDDGGKIMSLLLSSKVICENPFFCRKKRWFDSFDLCNLSCSSEVGSKDTLAKEQQKNYRVLFRVLLPIIGYEIITHFWRNITFSDILAFNDLCWPQWQPRIKTTSTNM